ncbi:MAG: amidohydrolase family protein [Abditibacteriota bacterium]|nr:amidohydrolase family protein [Abditibacteriota bacterium]
MTFKEKMLKYGKINDCPIIDMHAHWYKFYGAALPTTSLEDSLKLFEDSNVKKVIISSHLACESPIFGNQASIDIAKQKPDIFRVMFNINPNHPDVIEKDIANWDKYGDIVVGFKALGDYTKIPFDSGAFDTAFEYANEKGCMFLLHTWGKSPYNDSKNVKYVLDKYPNIKVSAGHSIHGEWETSMHFALDYENYYFDIVAIPDEREVIEKWFSEPKVVDKMFFGTDYPWFSYHYYIGAMLDTGLNEESLRKVFYGNAQRVFEWAR